MANIQIVERPDLWFGCFNYCVKFHVNEAGCLRELDHKKIDRNIRARREWGRVRRPPINYGGSWHNQWTELVITDQDVVTLHQLCDFFTQDNRNRRITISGNTIYVYTNDLSLSQDIENNVGVSAFHVQQLQLVGTPGTIKLKKSDYQYRTYFKSIRLPLNSADQLRQFLLNQSDIRLGPGLKDWTKRHGFWTMDYFFIDHNNPATISMLGLIAPGIARKTVPIVTDK